MIAKSCDVRDRDWDVRLPYLLFAYKVSAQESTRESPFVLLYGRDARIPTETVLSHVRTPYVVDLEDYKQDLMADMSLAWKLASENIAKAQIAQKRAYDRHAKEVDLRVGERVMVLMPSKSQGKNWKLASPFHGPYRVLQVTPTNAEVRLVDQPKGESIFVATDRVKKCYPEQDDATWTGHKKSRRKSKRYLGAELPSDVKSSSQGTSVPRSQEGPLTRSRARMNNSQ